MSMKLLVTGAPIDLADELEEEFRNNARNGLTECGEVYLGHVRETLRRRKGPDPAPEGEPPAAQEGDLAESFRRLPTRVRGRSASSGVESEHPGAARLEHGKVDVRGIRTFPHPYFGPAAEASEAEITAILTKLVR